MLTEIRLINYKAFLCEKIALQPMTVFIGPNGSGKSSVAWALFQISTIIRFGLSAAFPPGFLSFPDLRNFEPLNCGYDSAPIGLGISGTVKGLSFDYDILFTFTWETRPIFHVHYEGIKLQTEGAVHHYTLGKSPRLDFELPTDGGLKAVVGIEQGLERDCLFVECEKSEESSYLLPQLRKIKKYLQTMGLYEFLASATQMPVDSYAGGGAPILTRDGSNLAQVVQYLQEEHRGLLGKVREWISKYSEGANRIVDIGVAILGGKVFLNFFEEGRKKKSFVVRGPLVSDGYWVFTAFACLACSPTLPSIAFFDEPESHLHPHKLPVLVDVFRSMISREEDPCQVLISSHSPYFLDLFKETPQSVVFLRNGKAMRLDQMPDYEKVLSLYSIGEAWYSNVFDWGNPRIITGGPENADRIDG